MRDRLIEVLKSNSCSFYECPDNNCIDCEHYALFNDDVEKIADTVLADGWIRPPVKVGDKVYYFSENPLCLSVQPYRIYEADVVRIVTVGLGTSLVIQIRNEYGCTEIPDVNEWGKTVFLSREEAEKVLKGGGE